MEKFLAFGEKNWNVLAVAFGVVMVLCVVAKKLGGCFADVPVTPFVFYALLALLSIPCRKISQIPEKYWYPICLGSLAFPFFCFLLGSLGFLIGIPLTKWHGVVALLLAVGVLWKLSSERKVFAVNLLVVAGLWLGCLGMASLSRERAIDGMIYHKPGAILMAEGWNPVWQPNLSSFMIDKGWSPQDVNYSHTVYFPKGEWVIVGVTYLLTGIIDAGDYVNPLLILVSILIFYHLLKTWLGLSDGITLVAAFLLAFNRIALQEMNGGMIDGNLGLSFLIFLLSSFVWLKTGNKTWLPLVLGSVIYGCTLKHTAPVYFGLAGMLYSLPMVWIWFRNRNVVAQSINLRRGGSLGCSQRAWWGCMGTIFVMVILCGWNPYVTNTWNHTSPFYPLHTLDEINHPKEDILKTWYTWDHFRDATPLQRFFYAHLIAPSELDRIDCILLEAIPVDIQEITFFSFYEPGGAWGIFPLLLIFSCGLLFLVRGWDSWLVLGAILLTVAVQPHLWWARFIPQMYAFPVLVLLILLRQARDYPSFLAVRWTVMISFLLSFFLLNSSLIFCNQVKQKLTYTVLEFAEQEILESSQKLYLGNVLEYPSFIGAFRFRYYTQYYLRTKGLDIVIEDIPPILDLEKTEIRIPGGGWIFCFPKKPGTPPQKKEDILLDYDTSKLPEALKTVGKVRWRQFCKAWGIE
ncbi:MAG: hypothetical protein Q4D62_04505 [Planctomycetia bacterium]|nr:hypothetical protein [Planctomycetia bacterium]